MVVRGGGGVSTCECSSMRAGDTLATSAQKGNTQFFCVRFVTHKHKHKAGRLFSPRVACCGESLHIDRQPGEEISHAAPASSKPLWMQETAFTLTAFFCLFTLKDAHIFFFFSPKSISIHRLESFGWSPFCFFQILFLFFFFQNSGGIFFFYLLRPIFPSHCVLDGLRTTSSLLVSVHF